MRLTIHLNPRLPIIKFAQLVEGLLWQGEMTSEISNERKFVDLDRDWDFYYFFIQEDLGTRRSGGLDLRDSCFLRKAFP